MERNKERFIIEQIGNCYKEIAELIDETIPEAWKNVKLYVEGWEGYSTAYFYYYPESNEKPILSYTIPERFAIDKMEFLQQERKIRRTALSLQKAIESDVTRALDESHFHSQP